MGIGLVLVFWAVAGAMLAAISAGVLASITALLTHGVANGRRTIAIAAALLPFLCLTWAGVVFVFQAAVNEELLHRDLGIGDGWHAPLPNGYMVSFIDVTDQGSICPVARGEDGCTDTPSISGVRSLQVAGHYLLGAADSQWVQHLDQQRSAIDQYFVFDTRNEKKTVFPSLNQLQTKASKLGISLQLEPIDSIYSRYRFTWFDIFAGILLVLPPIGSLALLAYWIIRLRRTRTTLANA